jgi:hypothetical protein
MNATSPRDVRRAESAATTLLAMQVDGETCTVRAAAVWPIAEVLAFEESFDGLESAAAEGDPALIADMLDSRMIASPRPRRRRQKAVSSRAVFYAGG